MPAVITGTPAYLAVDGTATPGAQAVTVPADAQAVLMFWAYWGSGASGGGLASVSSNFSNSFTAQELAQSASDEYGIGVAWAQVTSTGSKTITPVFDFAQSEGAIVCVTFVKNTNTSDIVLGYAFDQSVGTGVTNSASVTSATDSLVLVFQMCAGNPATQFPSTITGTTSVATGGNRSACANLATVNSPDASTTNITSNTTRNDASNNSYPSMALISVNPAAGGVTGHGGGARRLLLGVG